MYISNTGGSMNIISCYFNKILSFLGFGKKETYEDLNVIKIDPSTLTKIILNDSYQPFPMNLTPISKTLLPLNITGFKGGGYAMNTLEQQAAQTFIVIDKCLRYINGKSTKPLKRWAATSSLLVKCRAGKDLNAYYDRNSLKFFYWPDSKKMFYTCDSTDIVSHELGHAILDILRPDLWSISGYETFAFHESFGDITAMITLLQWDVVIDTMLKETNNDLTKSNCVSRISESFGALLTKISPNQGYLPYALRDAVNSFNYVLPETLPSDTLENQLSNEVHNFSRVFTGAWYDLFVKLYQKIVSSNMDKVAAVKAARDIATDYFLYGASNAPASPRFYNAVAQKMILKDKLTGGKYATEIKSVFTNRKILLPSLAILSEVTMQEVENLPNATKKEFEDHTIVNIDSKETFNLKVVNSLGNKELSSNDIIIQIPYQESYSFDNKGMIMQHISTSKEEAIQDATFAYDFMKERNLILSSEENKDKAWFKVSMKKLQRIRFMCVCQQNNCCIEGSPEYGKCFKQENNGGCKSCGGKKNDPCQCKNPEPVAAAPKLGCYVKSTKIGTASIKYCSRVSRRIC